MLPSPAPLHSHKTVSYTHLNNEVLPELESIEGVASVSVNGTIEEQVQVLLREEKIKEVNKKIRSALDEQFEEAQSELEAVSYTHLNRKPALLI